MTCEPYAAATGLIERFAAYRSGLAGSGQRVFGQRAVADRGRVQLRLRRVEGFVGNSATDEFDHLLDTDASPQEG